MKLLVCRFLTMSSRLSKIGKLRPEDAKLQQGIGKLWGTNSGTQASSSSTQSSSSSSAQSPASLSSVNSAAAPTLKKRPRDDATAVPENVSIDSHLLVIMLFQKSEKKSKNSGDGWLNKWFKDYPWLLRCGEVAKCSICIEAGLKQTIWNGRGTSFIRPDNWKTHSQDKVHLAAVAAVAEKQKLSEDERNESEIKSYLEKAEKSAINGMIKRCKLVYKLMLMNRPMSDYLVELKFQMDHMETPDMTIAPLMSRFQYESHRFPEEISRCIGDYLWSREKQKLLASPFLGLSADESTDESNKKQLIVLLYGVCNNQPFTTFGTLIPLDDGTALTIATTILKWLAEQQVPVISFSLSKVAVFVAVRPHQVHWHCIRWL